MLIIKEVAYKNFLSTGNVFTTINLNETSTTLVIGTNGAGKSTVIDAICFGLFGKPYRKVVKSSLVNSINKKDCVVQIDFTTNGVDYQIIRGIKPNIFEIYENGKLLSQDSATKDYQDYLEKNILRMTFKSFCQIVILGSANYTQFMHLEAADRRKTIEDLLDIQIFATMNVLAKQKASKLKDEIRDRETDVSKLKSKQETLEKSINILSQEDNSKTKDLQEKYDVTFDALKKQQQDLKAIKNLITHLESVEGKKSKIETFLSKLQITKGNLEARRKDLVERINFFDDHSNCPTCEQELDHTHKSSIIKTETAKKKDIDSALKELKTKELQKKDDLLLLTEDYKRLVDAKDVERTLTQDMRANVRTLEIYKTQLEDATKDSPLQNLKADLQKVVSDLEVVEKDLNQLMVYSQDLKYVLELLKDDGIKAKIIDDYLPIINDSINSYLEKFEFSVDFHLDSSFKETIKSRYLDVFSYNNFSEGEKLRINLAILFTWRDIARMRNSVNTNLLVMDEILDSSLDSDGVEDFLNILKGVVKNTNTIVISHRTESIEGVFDRVLRFDKTPSGFTELI